MEVAAVQQMELDLLLEGVFRLFGYDFRQYASGTLKRLVSALVQQEGLSSVSELQGRIFRDPDLLQRLMSALSVRASGFFRDADFYRSFRENAIPMLRTYPFVRIWHAGCANGEEVYSMAILMQEEGLLEKCDFYATDVDLPALKAAERGTYSRSAVVSSTESHKASGGKRALTDYFRISGRDAHIESDFKERMTFMRHNLVTDGSLNEFNVVFCRNVLIYFAKPLQNRVHQLLYESLTRFGILGLGANETLKLTPREEHYKALDEGSKLYRRVD